MALEAQTAELGYQSTAVADYHETVEVGFLLEELVGGPSEE